MSTLFRRAYRLVVGDVEATANDIAFEVKKNRKIEPNTADISVWNLNPDNRSKFEGFPKGTPVDLEAGYEGNVGRIFLGTLRTATTKRAGKQGFEQIETTRDGPDLITKIGAGDGEKQLTTKFVSITAGPATPVSTILREIVKGLEVDQGNLDTVAAALELRRVGRYFEQGAVFEGPAKRELKRLADSAGLDVSIQDGQLLLLDKGQPLVTATAILLSPNHGLVGSPTLDNEGNVTATALMQPDIFPGRIVTIQSERVTGAFVCEQVSHRGDTAGNDWYTIVEGKPF